MELIVDEALVAGAGRPSTDAVVRTVVPLSVTGEDVALALRTRERLSKQAREGVETLAAQVALALESASYAEDLHERQSAERFRSLVQNSSDVIVLLSPDLTIRYHTPSVERVLGYGEDELVGTRLSDLLPREEAERLRGFFAEVCAISGTPMPRDLPLRRKDGTVVQLESVFNNLLAVPNVGGVVVTARDVTERRALEDQLAYQAFHDSLTGLANRALFSERITHAIERGVRRQNLFAVLFVDLDDFKTVNDSLGHAAGDELLVTVAERIRASIRPEDTCARLGGDEFAVMVESIADPDGAVTVARRILGTMAEPLVVEGSDITVQASIGIALGSGGQTASEIMRSADLAMYRAKSEGKGRYALYEPSMHELVLERLELKADLQRAVVADEFEVHYQPIVVLQTGSIVGVEALVRWRHAERGLVLPGEFIGLAEETGLILPLGRHVLNVACQQVASWRHRGHSSLGVSVNLSAKQLASRHLSSEVVDALGDCSLDASALTLEITESTLLDSQVVVGRLDELRKLGVRIAIDDFGTGLLVAELPAPLPGRRAQDRQAVRGRARNEPRAGQARRRDRPARLDDGPRDGRRGHRAREAARSPPRAQVQVRPGLPLLAAGSRGRARPAARERARRLERDVRPRRVLTRILRPCVSSSLRSSARSCSCPRQERSGSEHRRSRRCSRATYRSSILHPAERFAPVLGRGFLADSDLQRRGATGWETIPGRFLRVAASLRLDQRLCHAIDGPAASPCYAAAQAAHAGPPVVYGKAFRRGRAGSISSTGSGTRTTTTARPIPAGDVWQVHEGDWEAVSVILDLQGRPLLVALLEALRGRAARRGRDRRSVARARSSTSRSARMRTTSRRARIRIDPRRAGRRELRDIDATALKLVDHTAQGPHGATDARPASRRVVLRGWRSPARGARTATSASPNNDPIAYRRRPAWGPRSTSSGGIRSTLSSSWPRGLSRATRARSPGGTRRRPRSRPGRPSTR